MATQLDTYIFSQLLEPDYNWKNFNLEDMVSIGIEALEVKSLHQRLLGKLAMQVQTRWGEKTLENFAKEVGVPRSTLYHFKRVEESLINYKIPDDVTWTARYEIVKTANPKYWIDKLIKEGLTSGQLIREIKLSKPPKIKTIYCKVCGKEQTFEYRCQFCGELL